MYHMFIFNLFQGRLIELLDDILQGGSIDDSIMRDLLRISTKLSVLDVALIYTKK